MAILRTGGTAVDAVEVAIKVLEDREITNAGYGSNLAMDGVVECDAVVVDHHGRSGAVGAVARKTTDCLHFVGQDKLTLHRNQESRIPRPSGPRSHHSAIELAKSTAKPPRRPRSYRIRR